MQHRRHPPTTDAPVLPPFLAVVVHPFTENRTNLRQAKTWRLPTSVAHPTGAGHRFHGNRHARHPVLVLSKLSLRHGLPLPSSFTLKTLPYLDAEKHRPDLEGGGPLVLEDVEADTAQLVDVWMVDFRQESNLCVCVCARAFASFVLPCSS